MHLETSPPLTCTLAVAAKSLGISRRQIYRLIQGGTLRKVKAGRRSLVPEADLRAFADSNVIPVFEQAKPFGNLERQP
jgi:excisionase family DNA binding protein